MVLANTMSRDLLVENANTYTLHIQPMTRNSICRQRRLAHETKMNKKKLFRCNEGAFYTTVWRKWQKHKSTRFTARINDAALFDFDKRHGKNKELGHSEHTFFLATSKNCDKPTLPLHTTIVISALSISQPEPNKKLWVTLKTRQRWHRKP